MVKYRKYLIQYLIHILPAVLIMTWAVSASVYAGEIIPTEGGIGEGAAPTESRMEDYTEIVRADPEGSGTEGAVSETYKEAEAGIAQDREVLRDDGSATDDPGYTEVPADDGSATDDPGYTESLTESQAAEASYPSGLNEGLHRDELCRGMPHSEAADKINRGSLPSIYSNRRIFPAVRNQGIYGTCWAFSALGCMEGDLIAVGEATDPDFSELQLAYYGGNNYKDPKGCRTDKVIYEGSPLTYLHAGGTLRQPVHLLSSHVGAVDETLVPYEGAETFKGGAGGNEFLTAKDTAYLTAAYYIDNEDRDAIKRAIVLHGGVSLGYGQNPKYFDEVHNSYYNPAGYQTGGGHAVIAVGWDDDFPKESFKDVDGLPKGDGAWLIRNSWGSDWGNGGYFWLSYYDGGLGSTYGNGFVVVYDAEKEQYDNCYSYDGQVEGDVRIRCGKDCTVRETFTVSKGEAVKSIGLELISADVDIKVTVTNKKTGETATGSLRTNYPGFYTIKLKKQLYMSARSNVVVDIDMSSGSEIVLIGESKGTLAPITTNTGSLRRVGVADKGVKIKKSGGASFVEQSYDPRIKLYTVKSKAPSKISVQSVSLNKTKYTLKKGKTYKLKAKVIPTNATNRTVTWSSSNKKVATVSKKGVVKAKKPGKATIIVTTKDGKKKARCKITVKKK
ncbi:MAG: Ig-like domain-containing protein [Lachnospiraceae bacterium]|nr:Ig-like domain-containing protein [Lachnospiraceae bacterium]